MFIYCGLRCHGAHVKARGNSWELILSFHRTDPGDGTQITKLGCRCLYPPSHLSSPIFTFLWDRVLLCRLGWSGICYVDQTDLELMVTLLPLPPECLACRHVPPCLGHPALCSSSSLHGVCSPPEEYQCTHLTSSPVGCGSSLVLLLGLCYHSNSYCLGQGAN